jgi:hypothetical protein
VPEESLPIHQPTTRREFARTAIVAVTAPMLAPLAACSSTPHPAPAPAPAAANPSPAPVAAPAAPVAPSAPPQPQSQQQRDPQSVHLMEALRAKYGTRLTDEQWEEVRKGIEGNLRGAKALHDFPLPTETEPDFVFRAYRAGAR